jgi:hypothetical protein
MGNGGRREREEEDSPDSDLRQICIESVLGLVGHLNVIQERAKLIDEYLGVH